MWIALGRAGAALAVASASATSWAADVAAQPLTLERAIELAGTRNERGLAAEQRSRAAEARLSRARSAFFPDLTLSGTYTRRDESVTRTLGGRDVTLQREESLQGTATLQADLFDARAFPIYRQARLDGEAARLEASNERRLVSFDVADAFLVVLGAEQVRSAADRRLGHARASVADAEARFGAKIASSNDVTQARLELASAEREVARAYGEVESAYLRLGNLVGARVAAPLASPQGLLEVALPPASVADRLVAEGKARRTDLEARRRRVDGLRAFAREAFPARLLPTVGGSVQFKKTNDTGISGRPEDAFAAITLTWPLYDGGVRYAEAREREALAEAANLETELAAREVELRIRDALVALTIAQAALKHATAAAEIARKNNEEATVLYRQGLARALERADAQVRLFEAEVLLVRERYALAGAHLALRSATGLDPLGKEPAKP
jgi:outer membrane protein TolC